jgi:hypothetical protein
MDIAAKLNAEGLSKNIILVPTHNQYGSCGKMMNWQIMS